MIRPKYKNITIDGISIQYAKFRKNRSIRITIAENGIVKVTYPYGVQDCEMIKFVETKISWIKKSIGKINVKEKLSSKPKLKKKELDSLKSLIDFYVYKYMNLMETEIFDVKIRKMKTEWGNCNYIKRILTFNSYLYYMSESFIETIVVHEVAHMHVHNHSKSFYNLIYRYLPDYKTRMKEGKMVSLR